jgi:hypothetical protein
LRNYLPPSEAEFLRKELAEAQIAEVFINLFKAPTVVGEIRDKIAGQEGITHQDFKVARLHFGKDFPR